ncbi:ornithine carbamoyltransferase [Candidatus Woesearchaeota archaeon]|nr:ornithine carbamoyltransferase [Candidatus Woesearchaeota archaeon]
MHLLTFDDLNTKQLKKIVKLALKIKRNPRKYSRKLIEKQIVMFFQKPSLRTRLSFELGIEQMGGNAVFYGKEQATIGQKETWEDFAHVISSYNALGIVCRLFDHADIERVARASSIPVINALTNEFHPMQAIADYMTIFETQKNYKATIAFIGDAKNNVTHSLMEGAKLLGARVHVASPKGYDPLPSVYEKTKEFVKLFRDPQEAVKDADFIYTDSWMSYNIPEKELAKRKKDLKKYQVNSQLLSHAPAYAKIMHCMPATRGMEITTEVLEGKQSIVLQQAENRLHTTKAVLIKFLL